MGAISNNIRIVKQNETTHVIEPLTNVHMITDAIGDAILKSLMANVSRENILRHMAQTFNIDPETTNYYLQNFLSGALLEPPSNRRLFHGDYLQAYGNLPDGYSFHPNFLYWVAAWNCNLRCKMCPLWSPRVAHHSISSLKNEEMLGLAEVKRVITNLANSGISVIHITGGEPVLYPHLLEAIKCIKQHGLAVTLFTNGTLIDPEYAQKLMETGIDKIGISLDGTEKIHDVIRGKGSFIRAVNGISNLVEARRGSGAETRLYVMNTITKDNVDNLEDLLTLAGTLRLNGMFMAHPSFTAPGSPEKQRRILSSCFFPMLGGPSWNVGQGAIGGDFNGMNVHAVYETTARLKKLAGALNLEFSPSLDMSQAELRKFYDPEDGRIFDRCLFPWYGGFMDPNGRLYPCMKVNIGDLKEHDFLDLWNNDIYRRFRRLMKSHGTLPCCERCCQLVNEQSRSDAVRLPAGFNS